LAVAGITDEELLRATAEYTLRVLQRTVGVLPSDDVLEIGCGIGRMGRVVAPCCKQWIGTDIARNMLEHAAVRLKDLPNVRLVELSAVGLGEIPDASVDLVYCTVVFMHLAEWDRFRYVAEAFRVLRTGGRAFFDNVDITSSHGWKVFMDGFSFTPEGRPPQLCMVSTGDELRTYAEKAGFERVEIHRWEDAWVGVTGVKRPGDKQLAVVPGQAQE